MKSATSKCALALVIAIIAFTFPALSHAQSLMLACSDGNGEVGQPYGPSGGGSALLVSGGTAPYHYSIIGGALPSGLTLNASTGLITGFPSPEGTYNYTAQVVDSASPQNTATASCSIKVYPALDITCPSSAAQLGGAYSSSVMATGGMLPYTYGILAGHGTLPPGLTLDSSTGAVTGTPNTAGTFNFAVYVIDGFNHGHINYTCGITVTPPLSVTCGSVNTGEVGVAFDSGPMTVSGGVAPYAYSIVGVLPAGLMLNSSNGEVTGTPTAAGTFTVRVTDALGNSSTSCVITINGPLSVTCGSVNTGEVGVAFDSGPMTVSGGVAPYAYSIVGTLPAGLNLNTSNGEVTGTPTAGGTFTIKVTDALGNSSTSCMITINGPLSVTCAKANIGEVGVAFDSGPMTVSGGVAPYTFSIVGTLPAGLSLNTSNGEVTGTPTAAGTFTIKVTDALGNSSTSCMITITGALAVTCAAVNTGEMGVPFDSGPMAVTGGVAPYTYSIVGTLPPGLMLNASNGDVSGTPTAAGSFTIQVTDALGNSSTTCMITINGALSVTCAAKNTGEVGMAFDSGPMTVSGGVAPYTFSIVGTLPAGLTLNTSNGEVTGTPTAAGSFTIQVTDALGNSSTTCMITIKGPLSPTCGAANTGKVGVAFDSGPMTVSGGVAPYTFSIVGTLPAGLTLNTSNGEVTGTPTAAGSFTIKVTDALGDSSTSCVITITPTTGTFTQTNNSSCMACSPSTPCGNLTVTQGTGSYSKDLVVTVQLSGPGADVQFDRLGFNTDVSSGLTLACFNFGTTCSSGVGGASLNKGKEEGPFGKFQNELQTGLNGGSGCSSNGMGCKNVFTFVLGDTKGPLQVSDFNGFVAGHTANGSCSGFIATQSQ